MPCEYRIVEFVSHIYCVNDNERLSPIACGRIMQIMERAMYRTATAFATTKNLPIYFKESVKTLIKHTTNLFAQKKISKFKRSVYFLYVKVGRSLY